MILIIGAGSMGQRRIRCLKKLEYHDLCAYDPRPDRCNIEGVRCSTDFEAIGDKPDAVFICTPPDQHLAYMVNCSKFGIPFFVEHGISAKGMSLVNASYAHPSCTMLFNPVVALLGHHVFDSEYGDLSNIIYHCGQYLPDWHPDEPVSQFYVSKKATGGAREIVPFELTWMVDLFGLPKVKGNARKTIDIPGAETIDDTYNLLLDWGKYQGVLTVDVVSRTPIRRLLINGSEKQCIYNLQEGISEEMYIQETKTFLDAVFNNGAWPNSLAEDIVVLKLLEDAEK